MRAGRRYKELTEKGIKADYADVLKNIEQRDFTDRNRKESPLRQAEDAHAPTMTTRLATSRCSGS